MRRRFNLSERKQLFLRAGGACEKCGVPLIKGWHADHVIPFALGGKTELSNAQALCSSCNLKKGVKSMHLPEGFERREWQTECKEQLLHHWRRGDREFFAEAYPGSGKTWFAFDVIMDWIQSIGKGKAVIVVPTDNLRLQWRDEAAKFGISLDNEYNGSYQLSPDYHGVVQTYATVANNAHAFKSLITSGGIAVLDEIHHAGDQRSWGEGIQKAFNDVYNKDFKILLLSGTPFRSDNAPIPFTRYVPIGNGVMKSDPHFRYGYGAALSDGVVRYVVFPAYEGEATWMDDMGIRSASFDDKLRRDDVAKRLATAQSPTSDNEYLTQMLKDAHEKLTLIRSQHHRDAAGLIVARDVEHARSIAALMKQAIGIDPVVVTYKDHNQNQLLKANEKIEAFRKGNDPWIVAVTMVSEGVDIKRLRVGVYLSNVKTPLFLIQVIGRVIRTIEGIKNQEAYFYFPKDQDFVEVISDLQRVRDHEVVFDDGADNDNLGGDLGISSDGGDGEPPVFVPVSGLYTGHINEFEGDAYLPWEVDEAKELAEQFGLDVDPVRLAAALRHKKNTSESGGASVATIPRPVVATKVQQDALRREYSRLIRQLCALMQQTHDGVRELALVHGGYRMNRDNNSAHSAAWTYARNQTTIYKKPKSMSLEELQTVIRWAKSEVSKWKQEN